MWKNDVQASRAIKRLLSVCFRGAAHRTDAWWTDDGPTEQACAHVYAGKHGLSHGESIMLRVALDFWNGEGGVGFAEIIETLDETNLRAVLSLARAHHAGPDAVEEWIGQADEPEPQSGERCS